MLWFFYWTTTDKLKFTEWSEVQQKFGSGETAIFRQRMMITPFPRAQRSPSLFVAFGFLLLLLTLGNKVKPTCSDLYWWLRGFKKVKTLKIVKTLNYLCYRLRRSFYQLWMVKVSQWKVSNWYLFFSILQQNPRTKTYHSSRHLFGVIRIKALHRFSWTKKRAGVFENKKYFLFFY